MTRRPVKAVSFDLWNTLVYDDSDEPKRAAAGLPAKREQRRLLVWDALKKSESGLAREEVDAAYDAAEAVGNEVWRGEHMTWTVPERIRAVLDELDRELPAPEFDDVVRAHEQMEIEIYPDLIEGCAETIEKLSRRWPLAIVSDAIVSPGRCLRELLRIHGIAEFFSAFAFSDEVGRSKPHRAIFQAAADGIDVGLRDMVHVGDRDHNDVQGAQALGMKAILFTAGNARDRDRTKANAVCQSFEELEATLDAWEGSV